jgi:hypothetical protein
MNNDIIRFFVTPERFNEIENLNQFQITTPKNQYFTDKILLNIDTAQVLDLINDRKIKCKLLKIKSSTKYFRYGSTIPQESYKFFFCRGDG